MLLLLLVAFYFVYAFMSKLKTKTPVVYKKKTFQIKNYYYLLQSGAFSKNTQFTLMAKWFQKVIKWDRDGGVWYVKILKPFLH